MTDKQEKTIKTEVYRFGEFVLDAGLRELTESGQRVTLQPKAFDFLLYLVRHRNRAIDKDELQDALWPRSIVTETALTRVVMKTRRAVGDDADTQSVIRTVHGHGYRFVAELIEDSSAADTAAIDDEKSRQASSPRSRILATAAALVAGIAILWWYLAPPAYSGPIHLAVLPVENATGDPEWDWAETGFMALTSRLLEDRGVSVVSGRSVSGLAGEQTLDELMRRDSEFQQVLKKTTGYTHLLGLRLESDGGLYRVTFTFLHEDDRPVSRTVVGQQPTELIAESIQVVTSIVSGGDPSPVDTRIVANDAFINEAYARAMSLEFAGEYEEAQRLFQVIIEQEPQLFWPRYEYALCERQLRRFDAAEQQLVALRDELGETGNPDQRAAVNNALSILYQRLRRNEEAQSMAEAVVAIAEENNLPKTAAIGHINLGLVYRNYGDTLRAYEEMLSATEIYRSLDIESLPGTLTNNMSGILIQLGRLDEAEQNSLAAVENFRLTGERLYESYALSRLSTVQRRLGLLHDAEETQLRAQSIREELGDRRGVAISFINLAAIAAQRGDLTRARQHGMQARDIGIEIDDRDLQMGGLQQIARADLQAGSARAAAAGFAEAEAIAREIGDPISERGSRRGMAEAWIALGDFGGAEAIAQELLQVSRERGIDREEAGAIMLWAEIRIAQRQWTQAVDFLQQANDISVAIGDTEIQASVSVDLARCWLELGDIEQAAPLVEFAASSRPTDAEVIKLQARYAAATGENVEAVRLMGLARTNAGESWNDSDDRELERYRVAAENGGAE